MRNHALSFSFWSCTTYHLESQLFVSATARTVWLREWINLSLCLPSKLLTRIKNPRSEPICSNLLPLIFPLDLAYTSRSFLVVLPHTISIQFPPTAILFTFHLSAAYCHEWKPGTIYVDRRKFKTVALTELVSEWTNLLLEALIGNEKLRVIGAFCFSQHVLCDGRIHHDVIE